MLFRIIVGLGLTLSLWLLVWMQITESQKTGYLTVEQVAQKSIKALTFDRHYAMVIDFAIIAPFVGYCVFMCGARWSKEHITLYTVASGAITALLVWFWHRLPPEAHNQGLTGIYHGVFMWIALAAIFMTLASPRTQPEILLMLCIVVPAFLFAGTHMFLGLINYKGAAPTFPGNPLRDVMGISTILVGTGATWARAYFAIPTNFWQSLN